MKTKILAGITVVALVSVAGHLAVSDDGEEGAGRVDLKSRPGVAPVTNTLYTRECGACHFAYQPGFLPAASWNAIMGGLADHFGENAELAPDTLASLTEYLVKNAADSAEATYSKKVMRSLAGKEPALRITRVPYIARKHHELSAQLVTDNPKVMSPSHCSACHSRADAGSFNEHEVNIPGFGAWDD